METKESEEEYRFRFESTFGFCILFYSIEFIMLITFKLESKSITNIKYKS
jgi:hypothetical protein